MMPSGHSENVGRRGGTTARLTSIGAWSLTHHTPSGTRHSTPPQTRRPKPRLRRMGNEDATGAAARDALASVHRWGLSCEHRPGTRSASAHQRHACPLVRGIEGKAKTISGEWAARQWPAATADSPSAAMCDRRLQCRPGNDPCVGSSPMWGGLPADHCHMNLGDARSLKGRTGSMGRVRSDVGPVMRTVS